MHCMNSSFLRRPGLVPVLIVVVAPSAGGAWSADTVGVPWRGEPGITEAVQQIMARESAAPRETGKRRIKPLRRPGHSSQAPDSNSPATGARAAAAAPDVAAPLLAQTIATSFLAVTSSESPFIPPDTDGAVGPSQIFVCVNGRFKLF